MCLLGMASLAGRKQEQRPKLMPVSAAAAVPAEAERAAVALSWPAAGMPANDDVRAAGCDAGNPSCMAGQFSAVSGPLRGFMPPWFQRAARPMICSKRCSGTLFRGLTCDSLLILSLNI